MAAPNQNSQAQQIGKLVSVVPVSLKEAALDSPTFRATIVHFADQVDYIEKWLDGYAKATAKLVVELAVLEQATSNFLAQSTAPINLSEAALDHDYTLLAMRRYGESARGFWDGMNSIAGKFDRLVVEPIRAFLQGELRTFKEIRRTLDQSQKHYDHLQARYSSQSKSKEASSLREDAFQLHESRKAYLKASMDFCVQGPHLKNTLDRLLVNVFFDQWRELRTFHDGNSSVFGKWGHEMDRVKGWTHEMETSEKGSRRELLVARKQIEEAAEHAVRPSRELDDYSISTVPYLGSHAASTFKLAQDKAFKPEKQGWLNLRTLTGKPTRTAWVRRWAFLKNGIFGCLVHGTRTGGVEESERIGVLLCSIRPAVQEERRFCFEVKTNNNTILLQAETQNELMDWIGAFEAAKKRALENPATTEPAVSGTNTTPTQDPAFAISPPPAPEFAADPADSLTPGGNDEPSNLDRTSTLPLPERDALTVRNSSDFSNVRRMTGLDRDSEEKRDHASRIKQKLDLHRKAIASSQPPSSPHAPVSGIPPIISASQTMLSSTTLTGNDGMSTPGKSAVASMSSLAPPTLANPPAPTSMSKAAVVVSHERGIGVGLADRTGGMPSGIMANVWGSTNWGFVNRLEREDLMPHDPNYVSQQGSQQNPQEQSSGSSEKGTVTSPTTRPSALSDADLKPSVPPRQSTEKVVRHRQTVSLDGDAAKLQQSIIAPQGYPSYYPQVLKIQDAQFRLLFPNVNREERLVLVFRATWSPNDQQEFPGRIYVTTRCIYFYSHHFGLVLTSSITLSSIAEVTAAPGRDCDFLFLHLNPAKGTTTSGRITIKTFLETLKVLQRRLNFLIREAISDEPLGLEAVLKKLVKFEESPTRAPSMESWEDVSLNTPLDGSAVENRPSNRRFPADIKPQIYIERDLATDVNRHGSGKENLKFKLPSKPVEYVPQGAVCLAVDKTYDISPKALFHVLFGDKSAVWQLLQHERAAQNIKQGPWTSLSSGHMRRDFEYQIETADILGSKKPITVSDYQIVDVFNDHLCYVVTDKRTPWHLPFRRNFRLVSKIVITHVSKSKSKLAIFTKVEWLWCPPVIGKIIDKQALNDLEQDALDLVDLVSDQVRRLGAHSRTKKAISIFGHVGRQTSVSQFIANDSQTSIESRRPRKERTLLPLLIETSVSFLESAVSSVMIWSFALVRWVWKTVTVHGLILFLLGSSVLLNASYSSRDAYDWWHERNASKFMARLGVRPNHVMSRAIYVRDLDETLVNSTGLQGVNSSCFHTFQEQNSIAEIDVPLSLTASSVRDPIAKSAGRRLQRTRQRLGSYRHDLLVALRVLNSIEREVLQTEWERWLRQENRRCQMVRMILDNAAQGDAGTDYSGAQQLFSDRTEDIAAWYEDYCMSCRRDQKQLGPAVGSTGRVSGEI